MHTVHEMQRLLGGGGIQQFDQVELHMLCFCVCNIIQRKIERNADRR